MQVCNHSKFKDLVHYICSKSDAEKLGAIKLNKILWFSDIYQFLMTGSSITGEQYVKRQFGPVPKHILGTLEQLRVEGKLAITEKSKYGLTKKEYTSLSQPDISGLNANEISLVDDLIEQIVTCHTAQSISEATHDDIWEMAEIGETIPYEAVMVATLGEIDERDVAWCRDLISTKMAA